MKGLFVALVFILLVTPWQANAQECHRTGRPFVLLQANVAPPDQILASSLEKHLRAELDVRGIDVCTVAPVSSDPCIARITLTVDHPAVGPFRAAIDVQDAITDKTISRTIVLTRLSAAARLVTVAASTDELLRASWTELAIADAPPPHVEPPKEVLRAVAASLAPKPSPPPAEPVGAVGVGAVGSVFPGLRTGLGLRISGTMGLTPRIAVFADLTGDYGLARRALHGSAAVDAAGIGVGGAIALSPPTARAGIDAQFAASLAGVRYRTAANVNAFGTSSNDWVFLARAGVSAWWRPGSPLGHPVAWVVGIAGVVPLRPSLGTDDGKSVTGLRGLAPELSAGVRVGL